MRELLFVITFSIFCIKYKYIREIFFGRCNIRTSADVNCSFTFRCTCLPLLRAEVTKFLSKLERQQPRFFHKPFAIRLGGFNAAVCKIEYYNFTGYLLFGRKRKLRHNTEAIGRVPTRGVFTVYTKSEIADYLRIGSHPTSRFHQFKVRSILINSCFSSRFCILVKLLEK